MKIKESKEKEKEAPTSCITHIYYLSCDILIKFSLQNFSNCVLLAKLAGPFNTSQFIYFLGFFPSKYSSPKQNT